MGSLFLLVIVIKKKSKLLLPVSVYDDLNPERVSYEGRCCGVCRWPRCKTKAHNCKLFFFVLFLFKKRHNIMNAGVHWVRIWLRCICFRDDIKRKYNGIAEGYSSRADGWSKRLLYKQQLKPWRPSRACWVYQHWWWDRSQLIPEVRLWRSPHLIITNVHLQHEPVRENIP